MNWKNTLISLAAAPLLAGLAVTAIAEDIVHDAEYYVLEAQNGKKWAAQDETIKQKHSLPTKTNKSKIDIFIWLKTFELRM